MAVTNIKIYKTRKPIGAYSSKDNFAQRRSLDEHIITDKHYLYHESYFAQNKEETVSILHLNPLQRLRAALVINSSIPPINGEYETVKEYKKELKERYNTWCCNVDDELKEKGR